MLHVARFPKNRIGMCGYVSLVCGSNWYKIDIYCDFSLPVEFKLEWIVVAILERQIPLPKTNGLLSSLIN